MNFRASEIRNKIASFFIFVHNYVIDGYFYILPFTSKNINEGMSKMIANLTLKTNTRTH